MTQLSPDNKIINGLWISPDGKPLSNLERLCIYSFCANGHDFHLWTYGDLPNVPKDTAPGKVVVRDGGEILPTDSVFFVAGSLSTFSDYFRWEMLRKIGGWWADMDIVCLRPLDVASDAFFFNWGDSPTVSLLKFPKEHFAVRAMADAWLNPFKISPWDTRRTIRRKITRRLMFWRTWRKGQGLARGGPTLEGFALAMRHFGIAGEGAPCWQLHLLDRYGAFACFNDELHESGILNPLLDNAFGVHISNEATRLLGIDKNGVFSPNSPFEILKHRYLPELQ